MVTETAGKSRKEASRACEVISLLIRRRKAYDFPERGKSGQNSLRSEDLRRGDIRGRVEGRSFSRIKDGTLRSLKT